MPQGEDPGLGLVVHQGQHVDGEGGLQLGLGEQVVEDHLGVGVVLEFDDDAHTVAVGLVPDVGDALQALVLHLVGHVLDEHPLVHLVWDLSDDDAHPVLAEPFLYLQAQNDEELTEAMKTFTQPETMEQPVLLEVFTNKNKDARMLKNYYHQLKQK